MAEVWYLLVAGMLATYVVLDGFDLGVGMWHLWLARDDAERRMLLRSVGPVWDGNEVWLIAAGGSLLLAFPTLLAMAFSGFYLPLMLVLWLLLLRALGIELRHQLSHPLWTEAWDVVFFGSSTMLAVVFGLAIGNVVRGVPLDPGGSFFMPLWTDFRVGPSPGIIDWYTLCCAATAVLALAQHGLLWLRYRVSGAPRERTERIWPRLYAILVPSLVATTWATFVVQPQLRHNLGHWVAWLSPLLAVSGLASVPACVRRGADRSAFLASCAFIAGMLMSAAVAVHPFVLPGRQPASGLTIAQAASDAEGLRTALYWWVPGILLVIGYFVYAYRSFPDRLRVDDVEAH